MNKNLFNDLSIIEPQCPNCKSVLKYGINTEFDDKENAHKCLNCGLVLK